MASNFDYSNAEGKRHFRLNSGLARVAVNLLVTLIFGAIYFYVSLPALNVQSRDLYVFAGILCAVYIVCSLITSGSRITSGSQLKSGAREYFSYVKAQCKVPAIILILIIAIAIIGGLTSWTVIRANSYKDLLKVEDSNFAQEVEEISFDKIPMLDEASAQRLGDRKLGELSDMVSQFEVAPNYTQINYKGRPVRVTPLVYGDAIKWFNNRSKGIPAYLVIDMVTQNVDVVRLESGIKYSNSEHFGRNLSRHLRFNYPTYMFMTPTFEVDDNGAPYWICPRVVRRIGLFGGTDIDGAVLVNACTGESKYYKDVPNWVDRVYSASLIIEQYDYYGTYRNGFFNSLFGQKGVTVTTSGYNYIAMNDDVYVYTGVTSAGTDQSNVGFILSNQRTKETKYYSIAGATEYSAMASAEGVVQHLNYKSTFPLLLNISSKPTYFMALKDNAQLVKMYAMVNVEQYQVVATGATVAECERNYIKLLAQHNITKPLKQVEDTASGKITEIRSAVRDGNTFYYIRVAGKPDYFVLSASEFERAITLNVGDTVKITFDTAGDSNIKKVMNLE